jgi:transposase-like protein
MKAMARQQRSHSIEFKRQVVQEYIAGETLYGLAKRHDLSRQLIRVWVEKYEAGGLDADAQAADLLHEYETKIKAGSDHPMSWSAPRNTRIATPSELSKPPPTRRAKAEL